MFLQIKKILRKKKIYNIRHEPTNIVNYNNKKCIASLPIIN